MGILMVLALVGCSGSRNDEVEDASGLPTHFDSTEALTSATVRGDVPDDRVRRVVERWRLAARADDATLFSDVWHGVIDVANNVWIGDVATGRLFRIGPDGRLLGSSGRRGKGPGEFEAFNGFASHKDGIAVWDAPNARISIFDGRGAFRYSVRTPAGHHMMRALHRDGADRLYLVQPVGPPDEDHIVGQLGLVVIDSGGAVRDSLQPTLPDVDTPLYRAGSRAGRTTAYAQHAAAAHWTWHPDGFFVTGNGATYELFFTPPGRRPVRLKRELSPVPVPDEERSENRAFITWMLRNTDPAWTWQGPDLPSTKAALSDLRVDRSGRIWVSVATPSVRIPDDELSPSRPGGPPASHFREGNSWEVFETSGRFLGRIAFPRRATMLEADGADIWLLDYDDDGLPAVVRGTIDPPFAQRPR